MIKSTLLSIYLLIVCLMVQAQSKTNSYEDFLNRNKLVDRLVTIGETHHIPKLVDSMGISNRNFFTAGFFNRKLPKVEYDNWVKTYYAISEAYLINLEPENARRFTKKILALDPDYLYRNPLANQKFLLKRFIALKVGLGIFGIGGGVIAQTKGDYRPTGSIEFGEKTKIGLGLKSSFFIGLELVQNPALKSSIRSIDFYVEFMFHDDRFIHSTETVIPNANSSSTVISNRITELQDWESILFYPRLQFNSKNDPKRTYYILAGFGVNQLQSGDFFKIIQTVDQDQSMELSPIKLYEKENMRKKMNFSILTGLGLQYRVNPRMAFLFELRYMRMLNNIVTDFSRENNPLQGSPLYYVDQDIFMHQVTGRFGVYFNLSVSR